MNITTLVNLQQMSSMKLNILVKQVIVLQLKFYELDWKSPGYVGQTRVNIG